MNELRHVSEDPTIEVFHPREIVELGDLPAQHAEAGNELRITPSLCPIWDEVIETTLDFSGIRLRNAVRL